MSGTPARAFLMHVGIDVAAKSVMVARLSTHAENPERSRPFRQDADGFSALKAYILDAVPVPQSTHIVLEATRTYWIPLATYLHHAGFVLSIISGAQMRDFARAQLTRVKTDAKDAQVLAVFAARMRPPFWNPPPAIYHKLQQRLAQRDAFLAVRQQFRNQLHALTAGAVVVESVRARLVDIIATITEQIQAVDTEITETLARDEAWAESIRLLQTIPGIGIRTAC